MSDFWTVGQSEKNVELALKLKYYYVCIVSLWWNISGAELLIYLLSFVIQLSCKPKSVHIGLQKCQPVDFGKRETLVNGFFLIVKIMRKKTVRFDPKVGGIHDFFLEKPGISIENLENYQSDWQPGVSIRNRETGDGSPKPGVSP